MLMKNYIFYTNEGFTQDSNGNEFDNCQILGWVRGNNPNEAFEKLKKENEHLEYFQNISCQELADEKVYYF
jgi:hypothetical protein